MPYRRFPKTDTARLNSIRTLLDNNDVYAANKRFIDIDLINKVKAYQEQLKSLCNNFRLCYDAQMDNYRCIAKPQKRMMMYVQHFMRVLDMSIERGEIKPTALQTFYTVDDINETLRLLHNADDAYRLTPNIIEGEKKRIAQGGRPIYNPTIGMVATHYDIFKDIYEQQHIMNEKADRALAEQKALRAKLDPIIVDIWNQVEAHFAELPPETRFDECRKYGLIYYYRTGEKKPE